jgi:type I restriction enzyme, S subunit
MTQHGANEEALPRGWKLLPLGELGRYHNGRGFTRAEWRDSGRPIIRIQNLTDPSKSFNYFDGEPAEKYTARRGDILMSWAATLEVFRWDGPEAVVNQHIFKVESEIDSDLHFWLLKLALDDLRAQTHGMAIVHIKRKEFLATRVPVPPPEQQSVVAARIEDKVGNVELGTEHLVKAANAVSGFRRSAMAAAITGRLDQGAVFDEDAETLLDRISVRQQARREGSGRRGGSKTASPTAAAPIAPDGIELPDGWTWATMDQLATSVQYGSSAKTSEDPSGVPVLRMGNIVDGRLDFNDLKYLPSAHSEFPELLLDDGDILFNRTNSADLVGKAAVFRDFEQRCSFASYLIRVRLDPEMSPELVVYYLNSALGRAWARSVQSQQVGQANVNGSKLKQLAVPVPPAELQDRITEHVEEQISKARESATEISDARKQADRLIRSIIRAETFGLTTTVEALNG